MVSSDRKYSKLRTLLYMLSQYSRLWYHLLRFLSFVVWGHCCCTDTIVLGSLNEHRWGNWLRNWWPNLVSLTDPVVGNVSSLWCGEDCQVNWKEIYIGYWKFLIFARIMPKIFKLPPCLTLEAWWEDDNCLWKHSTLL